VNRKSADYADFTDYESERNGEGYPATAEMIFYVLRNLRIDS